MPNTTKRVWTVFAFIAASSAAAAGTATVFTAPTVSSPALYAQTLTVYTEHQGPGREKLSFGVKSSTLEMQAGVMAPVAVTPPQPVLSVMASCTRQIGSLYSLSGTRRLNGGLHGAPDTLTLDLTFRETVVRGEMGQCDTSNDSKDLWRSGPLTVPISEATPTRFVYGPERGLRLCQPTAQDCVAGAGEVAVEATLERIETIAPGSPGSTLARVPSMSR